MSVEQDIIITEDIIITAAEIAARNCRQWSAELDKSAERASSDFPDRAKELKDLATRGRAQAEGHRHPPPNLYIVG